MKRQDFFRVKAAVPEVHVADIEFNIKKIEEIIDKSEKERVDIVVFPELSVTSYTCGDLFFQTLLLQDAEKGISLLSGHTADKNLLVAVGTPLLYNGSLYNCAVIIYKGDIKAVVPKSYIPNYGEFYEKRWFKSGKDIKGCHIDYAGQKNIPFGTDIICNFKGLKIGVEICEDLWVPEPPSGKQCLQGAEMILNLSASNETIGKHEYLRDLIRMQSGRCRCIYVYSSAGPGESTTDLVFAGSAIIAEQAQLLESKERFSLGSMEISKVVDIEKIRNDRQRFNSFYDSNSYIEPCRIINFPEIESHEKPTDTQDRIDNYLSNLEVTGLPFVPSAKSRLEERCREIINIQSSGLETRLRAINCRKCVIGISGGLDSTLALLVTVNAFDSLGFPREGIIGITMPGLATSNRTQSNAHKLMDLLGVTKLEIPIWKAVGQHFLDIGQDTNTFDVTYENSQARERTQILMDYANKENAIVVGTGDMSELALGWCTYNGDHMSMYAVNSSVPKTLVKHLVRWYASRVGNEIEETLTDILDTPISPELIPSSQEEIGQKTEDIVGPYMLHDFFLYHFLRNSYSPDKIMELARRAFDGIYNEEKIKENLKIFLKRFFNQQFKRNCMPDGPKVGSVSLSPRGDWRMPSDASYKSWIEDLE